MSDLPDPLGDPIAERTLDFRRRDGSVEPVTVKIGRPLLSKEGAYDCPYEIAGFGRRRRQYMTGVDTVQALLLTLQVILPELDHLAQREDATFSFLGDPNSGFPDYRLSPAGKPAG